MRIQDPGELQRMRTAFSSGEWPPLSADCPETDKLWASAAGQLEREEDEEILLHLSNCAECASIWKIARNFLLPEHDAESSITPFTKAGGPSRLPHPAILAAAASILIALGLGVGWMAKHQRPEQPVYRQQAMKEVIRAGADSLKLSRENCHLRWEGAPEGSRYDLVVTDSDFNVLQQLRNLDQAEYILSPEKIPTVRIFWRIRAHLPDGRILNSRTFETAILPASTEDPNPKEKRSPGALATH